MKRFLLVLVLLLVSTFVIFKCSTTTFSSSYVIARDPSWEPLSILDKETDMRAFSDELLSAIASQEDLTIHLISVKSSALFSDLDNEDFDGIVTSLIPSPSNMSKYLISDNYFLFGSVLIVRESSTLHSVDQLENKLIGVMRDSSVFSEIQRYPSLIIIPFDSPMAALDSLVRDNIDGVIMDVLPAYFYAKKFYEGQIKIVTNPLTKKGLHLITRNDERSRRLIEAFNRRLKIFKENGKYDELIQRWDLVSPEKLLESP